MRVNQVLRGSAPGTLQVYEGNDSGRATFDWVPDREYLLFLFYAPSDNAWELDGCGNSGPLNAAAMALSAINAIKTSGSGTITKVESLTKGGKLVAYEADVKNGSKRSEVQVGPNGNKLAHEE